jgi:hypothetical protein
MGQTKLFTLGITVLGSGLTVFASGQRRWGVFLSLAGLALLSIDYVLAVADTRPLWLRSRKWALCEIERIREPSHPLHKPYWATSLGHQGVSAADHERALASVHALYERAYLGRFRHDRFPKRPIMRCA